MSVRGHHGLLLGSGDGIAYANVRLLCHADGADGSPTLVDSSKYARTLTRQGTAEIDTAQSAFGGASGYIPADINGWTTPSDATLDMRGGPFQIDWRHRLAANMASTTQYDTVLALVDGSSWLYEWAAIVQRHYMLFYYGRRGVSSGGIRFLYPSGYDFNTLGGSFVPLRIARDVNGDWGAWINGKLCPQYQFAAQSPVPTFAAPVTGTYNNSLDFGASGARTLNIGRLWTFASFAVDKHFDELRYVIGESCDVHEDYTPLATPFPDR